MRRITLLTAALILAVAPMASAKPTIIKGAKCTACHEGAPKDKKFNAAATKMVAKYKDTQCKDCHGFADGKLTIIKK